MYIWPDTGAVPPSSCDHIYPNYVDRFGGEWTGSQGGWNAEGFALILEAVRSHCRTEEEDRRFWTAVTFNELTDLQRGLRGEKHCSQDQILKTTLLKQLGNHVFQRNPCGWHVFLQWVNGYNNPQMLFQGKMALRSSCSLLWFTQVISFLSWKKRVLEQGYSMPCPATFKKVLSKQHRCFQQMVRVNPPAASVITLQVGHDHPPREDKSHLRNNRMGQAQLLRRRLHVCFYA